MARSESQSGSCDGIDAIGYCPRSRELAEQVTKLPGSHEQYGPPICEEGKNPLQGGQTSIQNFNESFPDPRRSYRCGVPGWSPLVLLENGIDQAQPRPQLRLLPRLLSLAAEWHRVAKHLPNRLSRYPKLPGYPTFTATLHQYRSPHPPVKSTLNIPPVSHELRFSPTGS
jgi:hypothetical protein